MQRMQQEYFKDRTIFYSAFPLREQAIRCFEWNFSMQADAIGLLGSQIDDGPAYRDDVKLVDLGTGKIFYDKLTYIYLEMPKRRVQEAALASRLEEWIYARNNMYGLEEFPERFEKEKVFKQFFHEASVPLLSREERIAYEKSLMDQWNMNGVLNTANREGNSEGQNDEKRETAKCCIAHGMSVAGIAAITGLSEEEVEGLSVVDHAAGRTRGLERLIQAAPLITPHPELEDATIIRETISRQLLTAYLGQEGQLLAHG